jgi:hypothetical protein
MNGVDVPMAPSAIHSQNMRVSFEECPWLPSCVTTLCSCEARISARTSPMACASGFSQ